MAFNTLQRLGIPQQDWMEWAKWWYAQELARRAAAQAAAAAEAAAAAVAAAEAEVVAAESAVGTAQSMLSSLGAGMAALLLFDRFYNGWGPSIAEALFGDQNTPEIPSTPPPPGPGPF